MKTKVLLEVNSEEVPLNRYAESVFEKINWALVETLKGLDLDNIRLIKIKIEKTE